MATTTKCRPETRQAEHTPLIAQSGIQSTVVAGTALVGADVEVPLVVGGVRRYVNLDYAASAPCLVAVKQAVDALLPWYSSVHRGACRTIRVLAVAADR